MEGGGFGEMIIEIEDFLVCFDFTSERLRLPFHSYVEETVSLSCVYISACIYARQWRFGLPLRSSPMWCRGA